MKKSCQRIPYSIISIYGKRGLSRVFTARRPCFLRSLIYHHPDESPLVSLAVADLGGSVYTATAPSLTGAPCTRSQRSIESKSMESFFGARSDIHIQNTILPSMTAFSLQLGETRFITSRFYSSCSRFPLGRMRSSISSGKQVPLKSHCLSAETEKQPEAEALDYLPLVSCARHVKCVQVYLLVSFLSPIIRCVCSWPQEHFC